ncbi:hypothetical protein HNR40_006976 [Nonomuraea endophytica]|uniref:Transposase IS204/IS1001/IS1096/IS1165 zinc-finger domain-containing protein n=1 Tax=Nonomuraea endophytica TaxID=714136 RepID=A0A7W8A8B2_9ACTN|nr:hypothetical protein [Nonomuraea endophytica]
MLKISDLTDVVFAGLSALVIEGVKDENNLIRVMTRTRDKPVPCPVCGTLTGRVHGYYSRTVADVPVDGRRVVVSVRGRCLLCPAGECARQTFREQVPGLLERYHRRTSRLTGQLGAVVTELAGRAGGRAGARLSAVLASRSPDPGHCGCSCGCHCHRCGPRVCWVSMTSRSSAATVMPPS